MRTLCTLVAMDLSLDDWMTAQGVTDAQLAEQVGHVVSRSQINRIRRGRRTSPDVAVELERITGIPAVTFLMGVAA